MQFGIWLPVYGGWLRTREQTVEPDVAACLAIAQQAEAVGFDFLYASENLLNCIHGPRVGVVDAWTLVSVLAATTARISLCAAIKPGFRSPLLVARMIDTLTKVAGRRLAINIVCGWWKDEFELADVEWLDHGRRYDRADRFLRTMNRIFRPDMLGKAEADVLDVGAFGHRSASDNKRIDLQEQPRTFGLASDVHPEVWVSGHSARATKLNGELGDCLFLNGTPDDSLERHIAEAHQAAAQWGRKITVALNAFVIASETQEQALTRRHKVLRQRNDETIAFFRGVMDASGAAGWANLTDEQMVDSNSGLDAGLIGSFSEVRDRVQRLQQLGVDKIVCQFDDPMRDVGPFMTNVIRPWRGRAVRQDTATT